MDTLQLPQCEILPLQAVHLTLLLLLILLVGQQPQWRILLAPPGDCGQRHARCTAGECYVLATGTHHILTCLKVHNVRWHHHIEVAHLALHGIRVDLAHVPEKGGIYHIYRIKLYIYLTSHDPLRGHRVCAAARCDAPCARCQCDDSW